MNINWDIVICAYGVGTILSFITYLICVFKTEDRDIEHSILGLFCILILTSLLWWIEAILQISVICYKWLTKPIIKKRKAT